jgi:hypothetical protein
MTADRVRTGTPARATAIAASRARLAAPTSARFRGTSPTLTVSAVSTTQPSTCTPMSSFARSPVAYTVSSSGDGQ